MPDVCISENLRMNMLLEKVTHSFRALTDFLGPETFKTTMTLGSGVHFLLVGATQQPETTVSS